ncbi:MAG: CHAP domain-containing protein [Candidatus Bruticola sp.]
MTQINNTYDNSAAVRQQQAEAARRQEEARKAREAEQARKAEEARQAKENEQAQKAREQDEVAVSGSEAAEAGKRVKVASLDEEGGSTVNDRGFGGGGGTFGKTEEKGFFGKVFDAIGGLKEKAEDVVDKVTDSVKDKVADGVDAASGLADKIGLDGLSDDLEGIADKIRGENGEEISDDQKSEIKDKIREKKLEKLNQEKDIQTKKQEELEKERDQTLEELEAAQAAGDQAKVKELTNKLDGINDELTAVNDKLDKINKEIESLEPTPEEELEELQKDMDKLNEEEEAKLKEKEELEKQQEELVEELAAAQAAGDQEKIEELTSKLQGVNEDLERVNGELQDIQNKKQLLQNDIDKVQGEIDAKNAPQQAAAEGGDGSQAASSNEASGAQGANNGAQGANNGGTGGSGGSGNNGGVNGTGGTGGTGNTGAAQGANSSGAATRTSAAGDIDLSKCSDEDIAKAIDGFLASKGSAAPEGTGAMFVKAGKENNVDPLVLLSIAGQETQWGKTGIGIDGWMGVGAYDSDPNNATRNSKFSGVENQINVGARTFANLREKGGSSADASIADQTAAVNKAGWATDQNWHNGVTSIYHDQVGAYMLENLKGAEVKGSKGVDGALTEAGSMVGMTESGNASQINAITKDWNQSWALDCQEQPWCAAFATGILAKHGVMDFSACSNVNYTPTLVEWSKGQNTWQQGGNGYAPQAGDMIMFDWDNTRSSADHVGIVESYDPSSGTVTTIEGNSSNSVRRRTYNVNDACIMGFIMPNK